MPDAPVQIVGLPLPSAPPASSLLSPEQLPKVDNLIIEDGKPVDNIFSERQMRLLIEPLYGSWARPAWIRSLMALANVGMFFTIKDPPLVPDVLLSLNGRFGDPSQKEHNSYFFWIVGKPPDAVFEIVSNKEGGEDTDKLMAYARLGIIYYVILDPLNLLGRGILRVFSLHEGAYKPLETPWLERVGLGLILWQGRFEEMDAVWLRWCTKDSVVLPTGQERAERLAEQLRRAGIEPAEQQ